MPLKTSGKRARGYALTLVVEGEQRAALGLCLVTWYDVTVTLNKKANIDISLLEQTPFCHRVFQEEYITQKQGRIDQKLMV